MNAANVVLMKEHIFLEPGGFKCNIWIYEMFDKVAFYKNVSFFLFLHRIQTNGPRHDETRL